jgi:hypothetical protein
VLQSDGLIKAGDLALVEFVGPKKLLSHGYSVYSTHWTIWKVIGVSSSGVDVEHVDGTRKMVKVAGLKCFDSSQLDEEAVWSNLMDRHARYIQDGFRCYMGGFFDGEKTVAHYLMGYLKPNSKTEINSDAVKKTLLTKSERFAKFMEQCI